MELNEDVPEVTQLIGQLRRSLVLFGDRELEFSGDFTPFELFVVCRHRHTRIVRSLQLELLLCEQLKLVDQFPRKFDRSFTNSSTCSRIHE